MKISALMTNDPMRIPADTQLAEAIAILAVAGVRHLPVVDAAGGLTGMLSENDALAVLSPDERSKEQELKYATEHTVADVMSPTVVTLGPNDSVEKLCDVLIEERIGAVVILDGRRLVGIASYIDVLRVARGNFAGSEA